MLEVTHDETYNIQTAATAFTGNLHFSFFKEKIGKVFKQLQPDIIDLENETFNAGSAQVVYLRNRFSPKSKIVFHASQSDFKQYPFPFSGFERYSIRHASGFMARNQDAVDVLRRKGFKGDIEVITHGVDPNQFTWKRDDARKGLGWKDEFTVGYLGAFGEHKGLEILLQAASHVQCNVVMIGDGNIKEQLQQRARDLNIYDRVLFIPPVPHRDVPKYLTALDVFVLPSRTAMNWREKFGRVIIEAMASSVPVVGSGSGEIPRVIGDAGLVFPEGDSGVLAEYLNLLKDNEGERKRLSELGLKRVREKYSWDVIAGQTHALYQKVLS